MTDDELDAAERRANAATPGPWESSIEGRVHDSGDSVVLTGGPDLYISYAEWPERSVAPTSSAAPTTSTSSRLRDRTCRD